MRPVQPENSTDALALLGERRSNLARARVRTVMQLHDTRPGQGCTFCLPLPNEFAAVFMEREHLSRLKEFHR
ncbi:hypothetical protein [Streptomyces sp. NPDC091219]|uniref:hypothetical protein n=1 Tax=Streptomyces sp. NPDC091219 TaxID=3155193 RepID=UPI00344CB16F